ncbi:MAG: hypothetical protein KBC18_01950 [Candidatus Saccharicenans sp.]|jgi:hypothetical protein|nr:hypothetical protein [Candidatus Saccharicenans sp.]
MVATSTVTTIVTILLAIDIIWLVYILLKGYHESLARTIVAGLVLGVILYYLQTTSLQYLTFKAVKNDIFPPDVPQYSYTRTEEDNQYSHRLIYTFMLTPSESALERTSDVPRPPELKLEMDPGGKTFTLKDPESLNIVLAQLNLPPVSHGVPELSTITGNRTDQQVYRFDDYPLGTLIVERSLYQNTKVALSYYCVSRIIIDSRKY